MNTALERLCDFLTEDVNEKIKIVKDISAGAVICMGFAFYITNILLILHHL
jgi:diacylglycerol kinase (ATP)